MKLYIDGLKNNTVKGSTKDNYHTVWTNFNQFVIQLDHIPATWEEKTCLYCGYLIKEGLKSSTIKSYVSAIKHKLTSDDYKWDDELVLLSTLTKACRIENDVVLTRLPIGMKFMEALIFELVRSPSKTEYQVQLYKTIFLTLYYGLMRIGEVTLSPHAVKARDVLLAQNQPGVMFKLYTSKTHGRQDRPQTILIQSAMIKETSLFCPIQEITEYSRIRPCYRFDEEQYFVFQDNSPVKASQVRSTLRRLIRRMGLDDELYDTHSFRIGCATDLFKRGYTVEKIKKMGRWRSNAVYQYLR